MGGGEEAAVGFPVSPSPWLSEGLLLPPCGAAPGSMGPAVAPDQAAGLHAGGPEAPEMGAAEERPHTPGQCWADPSQSQPIVIPGGKGTC